MLVARRCGASLWRRCMATTSGVPSDALVSMEERERRLQQRDADELSVREGNINVEIATRLLLTEPRRRKHFGLDWHLWQFFCMLIPPFVVYLVGKHGRNEIARIEKERGIEPIGKPKWKNRHEHYWKQRQHEATKFVKRAGLCKEDVIDLKNRLNVIEGKLDALQQSSSSSKHEY